MTWARLDDLYDDHRKVKRAWRRSPRAVGLHSMAITYSARHETDGLVDVEWIEEKLPGKAERDRTLATLVDVGLFEDAGGGSYRVHDFLDYNPSREETATKNADLSAKRSAAGKRGAAARWQREDANSKPVANVQDDANGKNSSRPGPSRPVKNPPLSPPPSGRRRRHWEQWRREALIWARAVGVEGSPLQVGKALEAAEPWRAEDPAGHFREFAATAAYRGLSVNGDGP